MLKLILNLQFFHLDALVGGLYSILLQYSGQAESLRRFNITKRKMDDIRQIVHSQVFLQSHLIGLGKQCRLNLDSERGTIDRRALYKPNETNSGRAFWYRRSPSVRLADAQAE